MLLELLAPPMPRGRVFGDSDWRELEAQLGTPLPRDHKEFNEVYGAGHLGDHVLMPLLPTSQPVLSLWSSNEDAASLLRFYMEEGILPTPARIYPEPGGLLEWAESGNGNMWFWETNGQPDEWTVAVVPESYDDPPIYRYPLSATSYLAALLRGDLDDDFPADLLTLDPPLTTFTPSLID